MLENWDWILFDADETLFHFDAFTGLQRMFGKYNVRFSVADFEEYQSINQPLWVDYQNGVIDALQLQSLRFQRWSEKLGTTIAQLNSDYVSAMAEICQPLPGAASLLRQLQGRVKMGIITNGFIALQQIRLQRTAFQHYFELLVISEVVGYAKPHRAIFDYALKKMGNPPPERVLMVGDNPYSDILGGNNAGLATCWLNVDNRQQPEGIEPMWQVTSLTRLAERLLEKS